MKRTIDDLYFYITFGEHLSPKRRAEFKRRLDIVLEILPVAYRELIVKRYYLGNMLCVAGSHLGVTRERIRQIETKSINVLRNKWNRLFLCGNINTVKIILPAHYNKVVKFGRVLPV